MTQLLPVSMTPEEEQLINQLIPIFTSKIVGRTQIPLSLKPIKPPYTIIKIRSKEFDKRNIKQAQKIAVECAKAEDDIMDQLKMKTYSLRKDWHVRINGNKAHLTEEILFSQPIKEFLLHNENINVEIIGKAQQ